jgi:hypothetical protein
VNNPELANEFEIDLVWDALQCLIKGDLGNSTDVDCIGSHDFDEDGMLTIQPPAARVLFMREEAKSIENQKLNYSTDLYFSVLCADEDRGPDPQAQRNKSIKLASQVKRSVTGARLSLGDGHTSEPIQYLGMDPLPTANLGMAYVPKFLVPGLAQFPGVHAVPTHPEAGENNG